MQGFALLERIYIGSATLSSYPLGQLTVPTPHPTADTATTCREGKTDATALQLDGC
jgi:hypothetical protein